MITIIIMKNIFKIIIFIFNIKKHNTTQEFKKKKLINTKKPIVDSVSENFLPIILFDKALFPALPTMIIINNKTIY
jgi:hypothetical protein